MNASGTNSKIGKSSNANQNIQVYVRLRPTNARERTIRSQEVVEVPNSKEIVARVLLDSKTSKKFTFDRAFGPDSKQNEVYSAVVAPLIDEVLAGYNCTVFAYGQTGTGKTHTMVGEETPELSLSWEDDSAIGIIPRALSHLFDELRLMECEFSMRVSYLELYNEELCDLLSTDDCVKIRIYDDSTKKGSVIVQGLEEIPVHSKDDVYKLLAKGQERRRTASTLMNAQSSRSHTVFSILVHIKEVDLNGEEMLKIGKLNLVDLAGSENISKAGNEKGIRTRETVNINQSLLTLGRVITALVERTPHIPYRESKLTRLLQESLGGRTKTSIIATISPGHKDLEETLSTLDYAHRAKNIQNKPEINQRLTKKVVLKEYTEEIDRLKRDLMAARDKNGIYLPQDTYDDMVYKIESNNKELNDKHMLIKVLKDELSSKTKLFNEVSYNLIERTNELQEKQSQLVMTEKNLDFTKKNLSKTKRRYNEKKYVLSQHVKTEEILTNQAKELIVEAEKASKDTIELHETIERRKQSEHALETTCETFTKKLQTNLNDLNGALCDFADKYGKQSKFIQLEIEKASKEHDSISKSLVQELDSIKIVSEKGVKDRKSLTNIFVSDLSQTTSTEKDAIIEGLLKHIENQEAHSHKIDSFTKSCLETFRSCQAHWQSKQELLMKTVDEKDMMVKNFIENISDAMHTFVKEAGVAFDAEYKKITEGITSQKTEMNTIQESFNTFVANMNSMLSRTNTNIEQIENGAEGLTNYRKTVDNKFDAYEKQLKNHHEKYTTVCKEQTKLDDETRDSMVTIKDSYEKLHSCVQEELKEENSDLKDSIKQIEVRLEQNSKNLLDKLVQHETQIEKTDGDLCVAVQEKHKNALSLVQKCNSGINANTTNCGSLHLCLSKGISTYESNTKSHLLRISDETEHFRHNEIKTYQSTGRTPARKEYRINRNLASTSPHSSLITRFRVENHMSDLDSSTVSECDSMNESSIIIMESTPMKLDDNITERKDLRELHLSEILSLKNIDEEDKENAGSITN